MSTGWANTVDFSPDGRILAPAASDGTVRLVDVRTRIEIATPVPGLVSEEAAEFTPDGKQLLVVYATGAGFAWDVDPAVWRHRACAVARRTLTQAEWQEFLTLSALSRERSRPPSSVSQAPFQSPASGPVDAPPVGASKR